MKLQIVSSNYPRVNNEPFEVVERKGIGHPDSLADIIADAFSNNYSQYCLNEFGVMPHHWADKVTIVGGKTKIDFGVEKVLQPIRIYQFGRVTHNVGNVRIDIQGLFRQTVDKVLRSIFPNSSITNHTECYVVVHNGSGPDHPPEFYNPQCSDDLKRLQITPRANDTSIVTAYAGYSQVEILTIELENYLNSPTFKSRYPETGTDIKILTVSFESTLDVTICIPFIASLTPSIQFYRARLAQIYQELQEVISSAIPNKTVDLHINTKDREGGVYLTAFGTAADKGDCGAVGRGNRFNGIINPYREICIEASSGKNPTYHVGRLYSELAFRISKDIYINNHVENSISIVSRNGNDICAPAFVFVKLYGNTIDTTYGLEQEIAHIVNDHLDDTSQLTQQIVYSNPIINFINRPRQLYETRLFYISLHK